MTDTRDIMWLAGWLEGERNRTKILAAAKVRYHSRKQPEGQLGLPC